MAASFFCISPTLHSPTHRTFIVSPRKSKCLAMATIEGSRLLEAAKYTVDTYIRNGMVVGLGCGLGSGMAIEYLGQQLRIGALKDIMGVPMSISSASEAAKAGIPLNDYCNGTQIDFAFNDADVMEEETLNTVIGRRKLQGGESIIKEKSILRASANLAFIVTDDKYTRYLDGAIPVLITKDNWMEIAEEIDDIFLGDAEVWRRPVSGYAAPSGGDFPLITKEGHNVIDLIFTSPIQSLAQVAESLETIEGVVGHGVIHGIPCTAVIAGNHKLQIINSLSKVASSVQ